MGNMGSLGGHIPSRQLKCQNCKQDVTIGPASEKVKCPRCGCGVFLDLANPRKGQPTQDPRQYTDSENQKPLFSNIPPASTGEIP